MAAPRLHGPLPVISRDGLTPRAWPAKRQPRPVGLLLAPKETLTVSTAWLSVGFSGSFCQQGQGESFSNVGKFPACLPARGASRGGLHGSLILQADAHISRYLLRPPLRTPGSCPPGPTRGLPWVCVPQRKCPSLLNSACRGAPGSPSCPGLAMRSGQWGVWRGSCSALLGLLSFCKPIRVIPRWANMSHGVSQSTKSRSRKQGALAKWAQGPRTRAVVCREHPSRVDTASRRSADTHSETQGRRHPVLSRPALPAGRTGPPGSWGTP